MTLTSVLACVWSVTLALCIAAVPSSSRSSRQLAGSVAPLSYNYHHFDELQNYLININAAYPQLTSLYSIGKSVQGQYRYISIVVALERRLAL